MENSKKFILQMFETLNIIDMEKLPGIYFSKKLWYELSKKIDKADVEVIISKVKINLQGLGQNYELHKEYLDTLAKTVAITLDKLYHVCLPYGKEYAIATCSELEIKL